MIVAGGFAFMGSMGRSMAKVMQTSRDPSMEPAMMKMMHSFASMYMVDTIVPALIVIALIWIYAARHYLRLANRIGAGLAAGLIATIIGGEPGTRARRRDGVVSGRHAEHVWQMDHRSNGRRSSRCRNRLGLSRASEWQHLRADVRCSQ